MSYEAYSNYHAVNLEAMTARASPVQLVLVLMDGLIEEAARARAHIVARRFEQKAISLDKCIEILNGLSSSLDFDSNSEVVNNLGRLYDYCAGRLYLAGVNLEPGIIDEVTVLLGTIRQGWEAIQAKHG